MRQKIAWKNLLCDYLCSERHIHFIRGTHCDRGKWKTPQRQRAVGHNDFRWRTTVPIEHSFSEPQCHPTRYHHKNQPNYTEKIAKKKIVSSLLATLPANKIPLIMLRKKEEYFLVHCVFLNMLKC